jgi:hypothetical protein
MCSEFSRQRSHEADLRFVGRPYLTGGGFSLKNAVFWGVAPCRCSGLNRRFGGTFRLHLQGRKIRERRTSVSRWLQTSHSRKLPAIYELVGWESGHKRINREESTAGSWREPVAERSWGKTGLWGEYRPPGLWAGCHRCSRIFLP